jgi:menaquinone-specific isochorismate synthase
VGLSVPAPRVAPETLIELAEAGAEALAGVGLAGAELADAFFWDPPAGSAVAGVGVARRIQVAGADRFARLRREAEGVFASLACLAFPGCQPPPSRLYGGLAFDVGAADEAPWTGFGDGGFTLPRLAYARGRERATLTLTVEREEASEAGADERMAAGLAGVLAALASWRPAPPSRPEVVSVRGPSRRRFGAEIAAIRDAIAEGSFSKIVAARASRARLSAPLAPSAVLRRLGVGLLGPGRSGQTRFAFRRSGGTFLGATPERLVARRGPAIETEALAGSIASGAAEHAAQLLGSGKDQREHQLVVDQIERRLRPLCSRLEVAREPQIRELRDVLHLHTPITGTLAAPRHLLELVEELHPTPAVGGVPTREAMRWIREHEREPRGWYAAPVGWFDAAGDGEFAVALRSCLLRGADAFVYAGAGIVRDSDPELEVTETELKKRALLEALGA